jgi:hypothetical protein
MVRPGEPLEAIVARASSKGGGVAGYLKELETSYEVTAGYLRALAAIYDIEPEIGVGIADTWEDDSPSTSHE